MCYLLKVEKDGRLIYCHFGWQIYLFEQMVSDEFLCVGNDDC